MKNPCFVFICVVLLFGCSSIKEYAPVVTGPAFTPVPNQQRIVSNSADQAVKKAAEQLGLARYKGRTARVEVVGVYPGEDTSLLDYIRATIEGIAMRAGMRVLPPLDKEKVGGGVVVLPVVGNAPAQTAVPPSATGTNSAAISTVPSPQQAAVRSLSNLGTPEKEEVRILAKVDWGGVDLKDHAYTKAWPLAGQILLAVVSTGFGIGLSFATESSAPGYILSIGGVGGAVLWGVFGPDLEGHTFTVTGRTKVTIYTIPQADGLAGTQGEGEGESSIVIDSEDQDGYTVKRLIPKEK
jgi:hypothetical protein